jgi:hypothetical protein
MKVPLLWLVTLEGFFTAGTSMARGSALIPLGAS